MRGRDGVAERVGLLLQQSVLLLEGITPKRGDAFLFDGSYYLWLDVGAGMEKPQPPRKSKLDIIAHLRLPDFAGMAFAFILLVPYLALEDSALIERILLALGGIASVGWSIYNLAHWRIWLRFFSYPGLTMLTTWVISLLFDLVALAR